MGLSKSKQTTGPSSYAKPYVSGAASTLQPSYDAAQANNAALLPKVGGAMDYTQSVLNGSYLNGNPHLQAVLDATNADVANGVNSQFEGAGRYGSANYAGELAKQIAQNEDRLRYGDYATERGYQNSAPGQLLGEVGVSSGLPQAASNNYADAVAKLLGNYNTTTAKPAIGPMILAAMASAAQSAAASGGA